MSEATMNPEGTQETAGQDAQSTGTDSSVDYKALYFEEVENAKKQRHAKQEFQSQLTTLQKEKETAKVTKMLSDAGTIFQKLDASSLNCISDNEELLMRMKTFLNK